MGLLPHRTGTARAATSPYSTGTAGGATPEMPARRKSRMADCARF